jgi:tetratricopeptide (TPR) repeat protein
LYKINSHYKEAEVALKKGIQIAPDFPTGWNILGNLYLETLQYVEAITSFNKAIQLNPSDKDNWYNLAIIHTRQNQIKQAFIELEKAISNGFTFEELQVEKDFIPLRANTEWEVLMKKNFPKQQKD